MEHGRPVTLSKAKQQSHTDKTRVGFKTGYTGEEKRIGQDREENTDKSKIHILCV